MKFTPFADRVLVRRVKASDKTAAGLFLPTEAQSKQRPHHGEVLAVGDEIREDIIRVGDVVAYGKFAGTEVQLSELEDDEHLVLSYSDILGKVEAATE